MTTHYYRQYPNALDELHSCFNPQQFQYLLSALSEDVSTLSETDSLILDADDSIQGTLWSSSDSQQLSSKEQELFNKLESPSKVGDGYQREQQLVPTDCERLGPFSSNRLVLPLSKLNRRPNLLKLSLDSTITSANTREENSSISRYGVTSNDSMLAWPGLSMQNLAENVDQVQIKYAKVPLPSVVFPDTRQGKIYDEGKLNHDTRVQTCSHLPMCKRIMGKYVIPIERKSRSSSVECVKAETLPDLDNPMLEIAGKIANEPINPFPVLKNVPFKKLPRMSMMSMTTSTKRVVGGGTGRSNSVTLDGFLIEQGIDRELDMFQDYKNVGEFFSHGDMAHSKTRKVAAASGGMSRLSKRVTNPLYKEYDPAGYQKSEDEMAVECIQMICDDFNKWIKFLATSKKKNDEKCDHENKDELGENKDTTSEEETIIIGPEFLIQILRTELELPEKY